MKNKVLIDLYIVSIDKHLDLYIPVNQAIVSSAFDLYDIQPVDKEYYLVDPNNGEIYQNNQIVRNTNIKNAKSVYLV